MAMAASTACRAWSGSGLGAPKKAMMASPMYLSRVPPRRKIWSVMTSKERLRMAASLQGLHALATCG